MNNTAYDKIYNIGKQHSSKMNGSFAPRVSGLYPNQTGQNIKVMSLHISGRRGNISHIHNLPMAYVKLQLKSSAILYFLIRVAFARSVLGSQHCDVFSRSLNVKICENSSPPPPRTSPYKTHSLQSSVK